MITLPELYQIVEESSHETAFNYGEVEGLYNLIKFVRPRVCVEIGVEFGRSTTVFAELQKELNYLFFAADAWVGEYGRQAYEHVQDQIEKHGWDIHLYGMYSKELAEDWHIVAQGYMDIDILHIDGDHEYEAVKTDIQLWTPFVRSGGYIAFDDYGHDSLPGVYQAAQELMTEDKFAFIDRYGNKLGVFKKL